MKHSTVLIWVLGLGLAFWSAGCRTSSGRTTSGGTEESEIALEDRAEAFAHYSAGVIQSLNGNPALAAEEYYLAAKLNRTDAELLADIAKRLIEQRQFDKARDVLQWAVKLPEADGNTYLRLGFVYAQLKQTDKAIAANQQAVRRLPGYLPAWNNLYLNYVQNGQAQKALNVLDEAGRQPAPEAEYRLNLAELYADCSQRFPSVREVARGKSLTLLNQLLAEDSLRGLMRIKLADGFYLVGENDKAARLYLEFLTYGEPAAPLRDLLRTKLTEIYLRSKDSARALEQLSAIVRDNPANAGAQYFLGALAMEQKRWDDAIRCFQLALRVNPNFEAARLDLAVAQIAAGKTEAALQDLDELRKRNPKSFAFEYLTGMAYHAQENYSEALVHLRAAEALGKAGETNRLDAGFYFQLGAAQERVGERQAAAVSFEKSLTLAPDNAETLNYLGYMWAEQGENLKRARELIERALKLEPDNDAFLDSMGWVLFKQGDAKAALGYLLRAIAKAEKPDPTLYDHLGDVYAALKEMDKAREAWAKSLELAPSETIQRKLTPVVPTP